jgi:hypothetical protein
MQLNRSPRKGPIQVDLFVANANGNQINGMHPTVINSVMTRTDHSQFLLVVSLISNAPGTNYGVLCKDRNAID